MSKFFFSTFATLEVAVAWAPTRSGLSWFHFIFPPAHIRLVNGSGGQKSASVPSLRRTCSGFRGWKNARWWPNGRGLPSDGGTKGARDPSRVGSVINKSERCSVDSLSRKRSDLLGFAIQLSRALVEWRRLNMAVRLQTRPVQEPYRVRHRIYRCSGSELVLVTRLPPSGQSPFPDKAKSSPEVTNVISSKRAVVGVK